MLIARDICNGAAYNKLTITSNKAKPAEKLGQKAKELCLLYSVLLLAEQS